MPVYEQFDLPGSLACRIAQALRDTETWPRDLLDGPWDADTREAFEVAALWYARRTVEERRTVVDELSSFVPLSKTEARQDLVIGALVMTSVSRHGVGLAECFDARNELHDRRLLRLEPRLLEQIDDDLLIPLSAFDEGNGHHLRFGDHFVHYHQFLRRGFHGTVNYLFASALLSAAQDPSLDVRVAIDFDRVSTEAPRRIFEYDHWFGPHLTKETLDDPRATGVTRHWRSRGMESFWGFPLKWTDFRWTHFDGLKSFEAEEIVPAAEQSLVLNRYVHSQRDIGAQQFMHLDGAVRGYEASAYDRRCEQHLGAARKAGRYRKLFRLDGPIQDEIWYQLVVLFFRFNELVGEYLHPGFQELAALRWHWPDEKLAICRNPRSAVLSDSEEP
ncbi:MAG: hypothetical protein AAF170_18550 [Bacteroidota bacterium]